MAKNQNPVFVYGHQVDAETIQWSKRSAEGLGTYYYTNNGEGVGDNEWARVRRVPGYMDRPGSWAKWFATGYSGQLTNFGPHFYATLGEAKKDIDKLLGRSRWEHTDRP